DEVKPYAGRKYQQDAWTPLVYATELAIYEVIKLTKSRLTNDTVESALTQLVLDLRGDLSPTLSAEDAPPELVLGNEVPYLMWNIRSHWTRFFQEEHPVAVGDLIGVLRTLLHSIEAHEWNTGRSRGYVAFLEKVIE